MRYVTYDETGKLTGCFLQDLHPDHVEVHIAVDEAIASNWTAYKANLERDGLELAPVVEPAPAVPQQVTRRQARQALRMNDLLDAVPLAIAAIPDALQRDLATIEWEDSLNFERNRPLVIAIGGALGLDAAGLDALFVQAGALP